MHTASPILHPALTLWRSHCAPLFGMLMLLAAGAFLSGCGCERYYCDDGGCYYCDGVGCREVEPPERPSCRGDFECTEGEACTDIGCVTVCSTEQPCPDGTVCRDGINWCLGPEEPEPTATPGSCQRNADCPEAGLLCRDGVCVRDDAACGDEGCACEADGVCAEGLVCAQGQCRPPEETCQFNHECGPGEVVCIDAGCAPTCSSTSPCPNPTLQQCVDGICESVTPPKGQCVLNEDCGSAAVCIDSSCYSACDDQNPCDSGLYCDDGACVVDSRPKPFCQDDDDCQPGHPCVGGICRTPCDTHMTCRTFDVQFNFCSDENFCVTTNEATSNCLNSLDCATGSDCIDGICR